jgi:hypothetical protein
MPKKRLDLKGKKFGRLLVLDYVGLNKHSRSIWECLCDCGMTAVVEGFKLKSGHTKSCGCLNIEKLIERSTTHGLMRLYYRAYKTWQDMLQRCYNPKNKRYKDYGGRGIKVCERWLGKDGFKNFIEDMGDRPLYLTIHRIDNDGDYELKNCKWETDREQQRNRSNNKILVFNGISHCIAEWADILGWNTKTLYNRYYKGWTDEEILTTKPGTRRERGIHYGNCSI